MIPKEYLPSVRVEVYSGCLDRTRHLEHLERKHAMKHLAQVQVPSALLRLLSTLPVLAVVAVVVAKLAAILPS